MTHRDGESLVLTRKSEYDEHSTDLAVAADLVAVSLAPGDSSLEERPSPSSSSTRHGRHRPRSSMLTS